MAKKSGPKKIKRNVPKGICHVLATFNNTMITITDTNGDVLAWESAGTNGYKGSKKSTPFAAQRAAEAVAEKVLKMGMKEVEVRIKGPGSGRETAIRSIQNTGIEITGIKDMTPVPHNGCRPRKQRRV